MPAVCRQNDICTGHGCWPPRPNSSWSENVICNSRGVHRSSDGWLPHTCPPIPETHASNLAAGSSTVYANSLQIGRTGDPVACGSAVATGSGNVFAGG